MAVKIISEVWESSCDDPSTLLILLALADWSNDQAESWPSIPALAKKSRLSERSCRYLLRRLESVGVLEILQGGGRKHSNTYKIILDALKNLQPLPPLSQKETMQPLQGLQGFEKETLQSATQNPAICDTALYIDARAEPSKTVIKENSPSFPSYIPPNANQPISPNARKKSSVVDTAYSVGFLAWWNAYPPERRLSKPQCFRVWQANGLEPRTTELVEKLERLKQTTWKNAEPHHIKTSLPYLNSGRYEDELVPLTQTAMDMLHQEGYFSDRARNVTPAPSAAIPSGSLQRAVDQRITQGHLL